MTDVGEKSRDSRILLVVKFKPSAITKIEVIHVSFYSF